MKLVGLTPVGMFLPHYPYELSGGQRQRVVIARALTLQPEFLVADEPVSMVDASSRLGILDVLLDLKKKYTLSCLYITHDIASARYMCDRIAVMYLGKIMEIGSTGDIIYSPLHPYNRALIAAVAIPNPKIRRPKVPIKGRVQTLVDLPSGCRFNPRCPYAKDICETEEPELRKVGKNHSVACHFAES
jgi:peptide/nickel transport system ATP-binding protein